MRSIREMRRSTLVGLGLILVASAAIDLIVVLRAAPTADETIHFGYGARVLQLHPDHRYGGGFFDSQMPVSALNAAFNVLFDGLAQHQWPHSIPADLNHVRFSRIPTVLVTLALTLMVFLWAYDLYGESAAIAAAILCMLSPNLIAHGTLITTDMYQTLGLVAAMYFFRRYLLEPTTTRAIVSGLVLALAQLTKTFAITLYLVVFVFLLIAVLRPSTRASLSLKRALIFAAAAVLSFIAVLNVAYSFDRTFMRLGSYRFETEMFSRLQDVSIVRDLPVPVPYPYLQGLDMTKYSEQTGRSFGDIYLLGEVRDPRKPNFHPFASYYLVSWFFKEPIGLQILFFWGAFWICRHRKTNEVLFGEGILLLAGSVLVVWLSLFNAAQIGIRHVLPALAVEIVIASAAFADFQAKAWPARTVLCLLVVWIAVSVARYYPQMIPYTNEWVRDPRYAYKIFADSNLDWGQDEALVRKFIESHPDVQLDPAAPVRGHVLVRANRLTGVFRWDSSCAFLSKGYQPVAQVGYAHFLFDVPDKAVSTSTAAQR